MNRPRFVGGNFAPPITDETLDRYEQIAETADRRVKEHMIDLIKMLRVFRETGESTQEATPSLLGLPMVPLADKEVERIWDVVPYSDECDTIGKVFSQLPDGVVYQTVTDKVPGTINDPFTGEELQTVNLVTRSEKVVVDPQAKALRDAANHLLWYARELAADREPMTKDKVAGLV